MKRILGLTITLLLIFICISTVNAEDISLDDNLTDNNVTLVDSLSDLDEENVSHSHAQISSILNPPVKAAVVTAPGGTLKNLQDIINGANSGDTISLTGNYYYTNAIFFYFFHKIT